MNEIWDDLKIIQVQPGTDKRWIVFRTITL